MSPLDNQDPLAQLNDIIAPTAPHWFPPAPLYWLLFLLVIVLLSATYVVLTKRQKQRKVQKSQLIKLAQLQKEQANFIALNQLLKGCALAYLPRRQVASLHGEQWFDFLQKHSSFSLFESKQRFMQRLYQEDIHAINEDDFIAAKKWIIALPKQIKKAQKNV